MLSDEKIIREALEEDIGPGDITSLAIVPENHKSVAEMIAKEEGVLAGSHWFSMVFNSLDPDITLKWFAKEGDDLEKGRKVCAIQGSTRNILAGERLALNLLQRLCGIATRTRKIARLLEGTKIQVSDTRKTLPLLRKMEKYAVKTGGGRNHRFGLYDMFLIKENHIAIAGSIGRAVSLCKQHDPETVIEVETTNIHEVEEAMLSEADVIMLDNMTNEEMKNAIHIIRESSDKRIEASGNMDEERIRTICNLDLDYISMGGLTHSVKAMDLSLLIRNKEQ